MVGRGGPLVSSVLVLAFALAGCSGAGVASGLPSRPPDVPSPPPSRAVASDAEAYCTEKGGLLVPRVATWNTNGDPPSWLQLAGRETFCEFETGSGDNTTRITVDLTTLSSSEPTLAAIAYLSKIRTTSPPVVGQNPA